MPLSLDGERIWELADCSRKWVGEDSLVRRFSPRGDFSRNVLVLATGTTISQALPVALTPILTRLYSPSDFGVLALFIAVTTIFGSISNGRYELAIMLPESDEEAINIGVLGILVAGVVSTLLAVPAIFLNGEIAQLLGNDEIGPWLYFVPPVVFLIGTFQVFNYLNNRIKNYRGVSRALVTKSLAMVGVQVGAGLLVAGPGGLVAGQIASAVASNGSLARSSFSRTKLRAVNAPAMRTVLIRYRKFPAYSLPANLANVLAMQLGSILISLYYSVASLGYYALVQRVLGLPSSLVGYAIGQVFFQQAVAEKARTGSAVRVFDRTIRRLALIAVPVFGIFYFLLPPLFGVVFGPEWRVAGTYAQILLPLFAIRFVISTVSSINNVFERQGIALIWQIGLLLIAVLTIVLANAYGASFTTMLAWYSAATSAHYLLLYFVMRDVAKGKVK